MSDDDNEGPRVHDRASMSVDVTADSEHNFFAGFTENISEGGLFIATHTLREVGTVIDIAFALPGREEPLRCMAEVRWVRVYNASSDAPPGLGLRFINLNDEDAAYIRRFVQKRSPIFWDSD